MPPTGDIASNPGICPDRELNQRPFGSQAGIQSTEPRQPVLFNIFLIIHNSEIMAHYFYGISQYLPKSKQLKIIKSHGHCFPKSFWAMNFETVLFFYNFTVFLLSSFPMIVNMPF